jgi:hypothetical protein
MVNFVIIFRACSEKLKENIYAIINIGSTRKIFCYNGFKIKLSVSKTLYILLTSIDVELQRTDIYQPNIVIVINNIIMIGLL